MSSELASELLQASDQYLLEGLKRLCEMCIAQSLGVDTLAPTFELSEAFSAPQVRGNADMSHPMDGVMGTGFGWITSQEAW